MRKKFNNIAREIRIARENTAQRYSQADLSALIGYRNGQFISNVERGLCSIPLKKIELISKHLAISPLRLKTAIVLDLSETIDQLIDIKKEVSYDPATDSN